MPISGRQCSIKSIYQYQQQMQRPVARQRYIAIKKSQSILQTLSHISIYTGDLRFVRHLILKAPQYLSYKFSINIVRFIYLHKHSVRDSSVGRVMHRTVIPPPFTFSRSVTEYSRGFNITTVLLDCLIQELGHDYL